MISELNAFLQNHLADEHLKRYNEMIESIVLDHNNIYYIYNFCKGDSRTNMSDVVLEYLDNKFGCRDDSELSIDFMKPLTDFHYKNHDVVLKSFYDIFNKVDNDYQLILINANNDLTETISNLLSDLDILREKAIETSDYFLNYSAIFYLRKHLNGQFDDNFFKKNDIKFNFKGYTDILEVMIDMECVFNKLEKLVSMYNNRECKASERISMFDSKELTILMLQQASKKTTEALKFLKKNSYDIDEMQFIVYFTSYYLALFESLLSKTKYKSNIKEHVNVLLWKYAGELANSINKKNTEFYKIDDARLYEDFMKVYKKASNMFKQNDCLKNSKTVFKLIRSDFLTNVGTIDEQLFHFHYVNILTTIRDRIDN